MIKKQILIGSMLCLIASMSWGAMFPVAQVALQQIDPFYFSFLRYFFVAIILIVVLWIKEGKTAFYFEGKGKALLFYGTVGFTVYNMLIFLGQYLMGESGPISASIMEVLMPMISIMLLWATTKKRPPKHTLISIAIALVGALLVITNGNLDFFITTAQHLFPLLLIFGGVMGWVLYTIGGSRFPEWSTLRYSTLTCLLGTTVSFVVVTVASVLNLLPVPTWQSIVSIKYELSFMVVFPGLLALLSWNLGIKKLSTLNGILFINFVPITTLVIMAFQGYNVSMFEFYGTTLVIFALIRNNLHQRKAADTLQTRTNEVPRIELMERFSEKTSG